jgi:O-antigen/teichoic acid export membrane protein
LAAQLVEAGLVFGGMLVLVRVLFSADYGQFGVVCAVVGVLNAFGAAVISPWALQLAEGVEPDWSTLFATTLVVQIGLAVLCNLAALATGLWPGAQPLGPLLQIASIGVLLECPLQLRSAMLRRRLDFRRMRLLSMSSMALNIGTTIALGLRGFGPMAIVVGTYLVSPLPTALDLFASGWRPRAGWWRGPWLTGDRQAMAFCVRGTGASLLGQARESLPSIALAAAFSFAPLGFFSRAQGLYTTTVGRVFNVLVETGYPLLPLGVGEPARFRAQATLFMRGVLFGSLPAALFVAVAGGPLVAVVYGRRWLECVPFIAAAGLAFAGRSLSTTASMVLLARGRMRASFTVDAVAALAFAPCLVLPFLGVSLGNYAWAAGGVLLIAGIGGMGLAAAELEPGWLVATFVPIGVSSGLAAVAAHFATRLANERFSSLALAVAAFGAVFLLALRVAWPEPAADLLRRLPLGRHLARLFQTGPTA